MKSRLQIEESKAPSKQAEIDTLTSMLSEARAKASDDRASALKVFNAKQAASDAKLVSTEHECATLRGELADARLSMRQSTDAADSSKRLVEQLLPSLHPRLKSLMRWKPCAVKLRNVR